MTQAELMALPDGTLYAPLHEPWVFGEVRIKGENVGANDFYARDLNWIDANDCGEAIDRLEAMLKDGSLSFPVEQAYSREGYYDGDACKRSCQHPPRSARRTGF
ncbi:hypothetical protein [Mycobacterium intracellulare]|uniref:hypothetical protein n=1 Tax=Mycobacterium intracellulare TaxID=1767 RepID=UPI0013E0AA7A|nr:hypothetical protein [Mycobacterium intracellulare]